MRDNAVHPYLLLNMSIYFIIILKVQFLCITIIILYYHSIINYHLNYFKIIILKVNKFIIS